MTSSLWPLQVFDPKADVAVVERKLPHWSQAGTLCFITFRTHDSFPQHLLVRWHADRAAWLKQHGVNSQENDWRAQLQKLSRALQAEFTDTFSQRWHDGLDACHGACDLRNPACAQIVAQSLLHFQGERYLLTDFVVMPNHVHLLAAFLDETSMLAQCESWKRFTAREINALCGLSGRFWQQDGFDHLVRTPEHFDHFRRYIADNPHKAQLQPGEYIYYSESL